MKKITLFTLSVLATALMSVSAEEAKPVNTQCPYSGEDIDAEQVVAYTKVVGVCCEKCQAKLTSKAGENLEKIAAVKAVHVNTQCPFSGEDVDAEITADYKGAKVALCCKKCQGKFDAEKHGSKVVMDNAGNDKCVFSNKGIDPEAHAVISFQVGLCCGKCAKKFAAEPDKALAKVKFAKAG
jgi:hypothetical protein